MKQHFPEQNRFVQSLLSGSSVKEAGTAVGISTRTAYRRYGEVKEALAGLQTDLLKNARDELYGGVVRSVNKLFELLDCGDARTELAAARTVLEFALPTKHHVEINAVNNAEISRPELTDERLHEIFSRLGEEDHLKDPADQEKYRRYKSEYEAAAKDALWDMIPSSFNASAPEWQRMQEWRRRSFPALNQARFQMLRLLKRCLEPEDESNGNTPGTFSPPV